jgi:hypothetical protein
MAKELPVGGIYVVLIVVALGIAAMYFLKDSIMSIIQSMTPNKDAPNATQTGTTATGQPIVGSDVKYVNPIICAMSGKFCDPNANPTNTENTQTPVGTFNGLPVYQQDNGYTVTPPGEITTVYCEKNPALQIQKATDIVNKLNKGITPTLDEARWARKCEPSLFGMMGADLRSAVISSAGVV